MNATRTVLSPRLALILAIALEVFVAVAGWLLRIRGYRGLPVLFGLHFPVMLGFLWLFLRYFRDPVERHRAMPRDPAFLLILLASLIVLPLGGFEDRTTLGGKLMFFLFLPIVLFREDLFYRGILQGALERVMHPAVAIILATVGHIACHAPVEEINALNISIIGSAGILIGAVYQITRSIAWATAVHVVGDWVLLVPAPAVLDHDAVLAVNVLITIAVFAWWADVRRRMRPL